MSVSNPNVCRTDTLMSGSGAAVSVTAVIAPPCENPQQFPGNTSDRRTGRTPLGYNARNPLSHEFAHPDTRHQRGAGGSHPADRMSAINLTESRRSAEANDDGS